MDREGEDDWEDQDGSEEGEEIFEPPSQFPFDGWDKPSGVRKPGKEYSPYYKGDNSGGFGNAPLSGQRKKGDPGGPGRPKGQTSLRAALTRALRRKRPILRDGKVTHLHTADVVAERIVEAILAKNLSPAMIELARRLMEQYGPQMPEPEPPEGSREGFSPDELSILSGFLGRYIGEEPGEVRRSVLGTVSEPYPQGEFRLFKRPDGHIGAERIAPADSGS
jgi:hypothetical protein